MKIITQRQLIQSVARKWRTQYAPFNGDFPLHKGKTKKEIADLLDELDKNKVTAQDVSGIIGNNSWTDLRCDECKKEVNFVVVVGEEPEYESHTASLCHSCISSAQQMIDKELPL